MSTITSASISNVPVVVDASTNSLIYENVTIDLTGPDGTPLSPQNFRIYSAASPISPVQVDQNTAVSLYVDAEEINYLNEFYGGNQFAGLESSWTSEFEYSASITALSWVNTALGDALGSVIGAFITGGAGSEAAFASVAGDLSGLPLPTAELGIAALIINSADNVFENTSAQYSSLIAAGTPIDAGTLSTIVANTLKATTVGGGAITAAFNVSNDSELDLSSDLQAFWSAAYNSLTSAIVSAIPGAGQIQDIQGDIEDVSGAITNFQSLAAFEANIEQLASESQNPFLSNESTLGTNLNAIIAVSTPSSPELTISSKATVETTVDSEIQLTSLFAPSITPSGTNDVPEYYTLINTLEGPGDFVINGLIYTQGVIDDVTPAELQSAYFFGPQAGTDEIAVVGFDSDGNKSNEATSTITITPGGSSPAQSSSDLSVSTAALIDSDLVAAGGGTIALSVENLGSNPASNTTLSQIYLSTTPTLSSSAILVSQGSVSDANLAAGENQPEQLSFILPDNVAGSYYLIAFAGDSDQVADAPAGQTYAIPITVAASSPAPPPPAPVTSSPFGQDPISIVTNTTLTTEVGSEPEITTSVLRATDALYPNDADLLYTIVTPPTSGRLIDGYYTTSTFTQSEIDNGLVDYVQNGTQTSSDSFQFYVSDPSGYRSPIETFTFNIQPSVNQLPPPSVTPFVTAELADNTGLPTLGGYSDTTSNATLAGTANPGTAVDIGVDSNTVGFAVADASGDWSFSPTGLSEGGHNIAASVTISGQTATYYLNFIYDTIAPPTPSMPELALGGSVADTSTPTFSGTAEANDEIILLEGNSIVGTGTATPSGTWTIETGSLTLGNNSISAEAIDPGGNASTLSSADTIEVVPLPPGEVTLNDADMIAAGDLTLVGTVNDGSGASITEYGPVADDGFTLTNQSRAAFSFITWTPDWALLHEVDDVAEYYDGADVLIVPTDGIIAPGAGGYSDVASATADTIDLKRSDGTAFSLISIDIGATGDYPTTAIFIGTTYTGQTVSETVNLNLPQNSPLQAVALTGFNDVTNVTFSEQPLGDSGSPTSIEFDNFVVGDAIPAASPTGSTSLSTLITLDDASMVNADQLPLLSTLDNVLSQSSSTDYGSITADGFTITNLNRSDFSFYSYDSNYASVENYFYDGPNVLTIPGGQSTFMPSNIEIQRQNGGPFSIDSIALDTPYALTAQSATFTGITTSGETVSQTFVLDDAAGMETVQFAANFDDLVSLQFTGTTNLQFDNIVLAPASSAAALIGDDEIVIIPSGETSSTDILSGGTAIASGGTSLNSTVSSGGVLLVSSNGLADPTTINAGGSETVSSGGTDLGALISGGTQFDYGYASGATVFAGAQFIESGGVASGTTIGSGAYLIDGGTASGVIIASGGTDYVTSGGIEVGTTVSSGGLDYVEIGGSESGATVSGGGLDFIQAGGTATGVTVFAHGSQSVQGATVGTVLSGTSAIESVGVGGVASNTMVSSAANLIVVGTASGATISAGGNEVVYGAANGTVLNGLFAIETVNTGASASGTTIGSGAYLINGGTASGIVIANGGNDYVASGGSEAGVTVSSGALDYVETGAIESGATVSSAGLDFVQAGATAIGVTIFGGGSQGVHGTTVSTVLSGFNAIESAAAGGVASGTTVGSGAYLIVVGTASGATISGGGNEVVYGAANGTVLNGLFAIETVNTGASASGTTIGSGAYLINGGTASGIVIANGGNDYVASGGSEAGVTVSSGALDYVETGAIESGATVSSAGLDFVQAGATATEVTIFGGGSQGVHGTTVSTVLSGLNAIESAASGGVASGTTVGSGAYLIVVGTASGATISAGGTEVVYGTANGTVVIGTNAIESAAVGGVVSGATIGSGGYLINAGTASGVAVANGGYDYLASGGSEAGVTVSGGALDYVEAGGIESGATVSGGGYDFVAISGSATGVTISAGGSQLVHGTADGTVLSGTNAIQSAVAGGVVSGTTIGNGAFLLNGGTASGVMVANGGGDYVLNGGRDVSATVFGGGLTYVESGGALSGVTISSGTVDIVSGAAFSGTVTFVNSGLLELGSSQAFSGLVAGFSGTTVFMDLQDIAYVSGGGNATTLTWNQITSGSTGSGTLIVSQGGHSADITLLGNYMQTNFSMSGATGGGTLVTDPPITQTASAATLVNTQHG